eukprot:TRINITY_DN39616_c0_g1_i2.p1 TRINITY_DN39616_c0_g1~~TRINITY_DN39616_c0_g1_i2.p1  ORF type:complete len:191 (+),score=57.63 TRINITY_DN39616_c0_g1_i2:65-637(+)
MGTGASTQDGAKALQEASPEELQAAVAGLSAEDKARLEKALAGCGEAAAAAPAPAAASIVVLVPIAEDSEEIETICITDTLVRAGAAVTVASVSGQLEVKMSRNLKIKADCLIDDCKGKAWDAIALPGGLPGAQHLSDCEVLIELLKAQNEAKKVTAAVCASPAVVFAKVLSCAEVQRCRSWLGRCHGCC